MSSTLKEAIEAINFIAPARPSKKKISEELLGKYKGIIPSGKSSAQFIKQLRGSLYGKI